MPGNNESDPFCGLVVTRFVKSTEWLRRLGLFIERMGEGMKIESLNVTEYGVYVVSVTKIDKTVVMGGMRGSGVLPARREIPT